MGDENGLRKDRRPAVAQGVAAIEGRLARPVATVRVADMSRLGYGRLARVSMMYGVVCRVTRGYGVLVRGQGMPRRVGIRADRTSHHQRKRSHGCKQPRRPRCGIAAHRRLSVCHVSPL